MTTLAELQTKVAVMYAQRGYTTDILTLGLGLCEEAGEVAGAINNRNPQYMKRDGRSTDTLEHELKDALVYLCAIANSAGVELEACLPEHLQGVAA
jgi:NTP pyrophosphatase (non-canonical NTP hydrolase)